MGEGTVELGRRDTLSMLDSFNRSLLIRTSIWGSCGTSVELVVFLVFGMGLVTLEEFDVAGGDHYIA